MEFDKNFGVILLQNTVDHYSFGVGFKIVTLTAVKSINRQRIRKTNALPGTLLKEDIEDMNVDNGIRGSISLATLLIISIIAILQGVGVIPSIGRLSTMLTNLNTSQELSAHKEETPPIQLLQPTLPPNSEKIANDPATRNVKFFGAKGDGVADDTASIQAAIDDLALIGGNVWISAGTYMIDALKSIRLRSGVSLYLATDAIIRVIPNSSRTYAALTLEAIDNAAIFGGTIIGDRKKHRGTEGEWGTGIQITGAKNITIQGTVVRECWGDGIYIGTETFTGAGALEKLFDVPENVKLIDVRSDNNRRQGISLIAGRNIEIIRPQLLNTKGTDPAAGLDIEPNNAKDFLQNIVITEPYTANNGGSGIEVNLTNLKGNTIPASITILYHVDDGSERGIYIPLDGIVIGSLRIDRPIWKNSRLNGVAILNHDHRAFEITLIRPQVINANLSGNNASATGTAISIYNFNQLHRKGGIGNISVINPTISDTRKEPRTVAAFHIWDLPCEEIKSLSIINPIIDGQFPLLPIFDKVRGYGKHIINLP